MSVPLLVIGMGRLPVSIIMLTEPLRIEKVDEGHSSEGQDEGGHNKHRECTSVQDSSGQTNIKYDELNQPNGCQLTVRII